MSYKTLERLSCNGHLIRLIQFTDRNFETEAEYQSVYVVADPDDDVSDGMGSEHESYGEALIEFRYLCAYYCGVLNWEAQYRYDEEHGTVNGYAPWQLTREY